MPLSISRGRSTWSRRRRCRASSTQCPRFGASSGTSNASHQRSLLLGDSWTSVRVATPQASCHQAAERELVLPVRFLLTEQGFDLVVGLGFQHRATLSSVPRAIGSWQSIHQHGLCDPGDGRWRCEPGRVGMWLALA